MAVSAMIDTAADAYRKIAASIKNTVSSKPIRRIISNGFNLIKMTGSSTNICVQKKQWPKFAKSKMGPIRIINGMGLGKDYEDNIRDYLELAELEEEFTKNQKTFIFNAGENSIARSWTLTWSAITKRAIDNDCVEYMASIVSSPYFKLEDSINYIEHKKSIGGGIVNEEWFGTETEPRDMS